MPPHLCPEIWIQVFHFLRNPLPRPHTENSPDSSEIRQPDLCAALRVSRTWYNLSAPLLYKTVVTDSLLHLLRGIDDPAIPGIVPKLQLLDDVTSLFVEYDSRVAFPSEMNTSSSFPYDQELQTNGGPRHKHEARGVGEVQSLITALEVIIDDGNRPQRIFHRLKTLSIGAFNQRDRTRWFDATHFRVYYELTRRLKRTLIDFTFNYARALEHYCDTGYGPLTIKESAGVHQPSGTSLPTLSLHTGHTKSGTGSLCPISIGRRSRWYLHYTPPHPLSFWDETHVEEAVADSVASLIDILYVRAHHPMAPTLAGTENWRITGGLYLRMLGHDGNVLDITAQEEFKGQIEKTLLLPEHKVSLPDWCKSAPADEWEVKDLDVDAPDCEACGWSVKQ